MFTTRLVIPDDVEEQCPHPFDVESLEELPVYPLLHGLRQDILESIDHPLSWEQLSVGELDIIVVQPLVQKYSATQNLAVVHACLLVRAHFLDAAEASLAQASTNTTRASLCEMLAIKLLRHFSLSQIELAKVLTAGWNPLKGASNQVARHACATIGNDDDTMQGTSSTLEVAIETSSKRFLATSLVQSIISSIYSGQIILSLASTHSILADNYKIRSVELYDVQKAPFLDHYRLRVPRYRFILDFMRFSVLLATFVLCLSYHDVERWTLWEKIFVVYAIAFVFDEYSSLLEYGWQMYFLNMWNVFDTSWIVVFMIYLVMRIRGMLAGNSALSSLAFDTLACGACILFPRLAFFVVSNQVIILALRGMIFEFTVFISLAIMCFSGLLFTLRILASGQWTVKAIAWLMTQVWFGNSYLSFNQAESFHPIFGPILMVLFAALSNTLLLTILISILSNTYTRIDANASQEYMFQFTIRTIANIKSDAMFSYLPPFNLLAYALLRPLSWILTPRSLHRVNVALIRITHHLKSMPILVIITIYERQFATRRHYQTADIRRKVSRRRPSRTTSFIDAFSNLDRTQLLNALFEADEILDEDTPLFDDSMMDNSSVRHLSARVVPSTPVRSKRRRQRTHSRSPTRFVKQNHASRSLSRGTRRSKAAKTEAEVELGAQPTNHAAVESLKADQGQGRALLDTGTGGVSLDAMQAQMKDIMERQAKILELLTTNVSAGARESVISHKDDSG